PTQIAAEVRDWDLSQAGEDPQRWKYQGRHTRFAVGAAKAAVASAGLQEGDVEPTRFGVYMGSGEGNQEFERFTTMVVGALTGEEQNKLDIVRFTQSGLEILNPIVELEQEPNMPAGHVAS